MQSSFSAISRQNHLFLRRAEWGWGFSFPICPEKLPFRPRLSSFVTGAQPGLGDFVFFFFAAHLTWWAISGFEMQRSSEKKKRQKKAQERKTRKEKTKFTATFYVAVNFGCFYYKTGEN